MKRQLSNGLWGGSLTLQYLGFGKKASFTLHSRNLRHILTAKRSPTHTLHAQANVYWGWGRQALALSVAHLFTFISMVLRNLMSMQKSSVEHLFVGLFFKIAESCTRPIAISVWEIKGVHYSLEGRKMVLRESLWFPLSAFSQATVNWG